MPLIILAGMIVTMMPLLMPMIILPVVTMAAMIAAIMIISMADPGHRIGPKFALFFGQAQACSC